MLRYASTDEATIWVQTDGPCEVDVNGARERTFTVHNRHYALVQVHTMPHFLVFAGLPLRTVGVPVVLDFHEAMPVRCPSGEFADSRFAITTWLHRADKPDARKMIRRNPSRHLGCEPSQRGSL